MMKSDSWDDCIKRYEYLKQSDHWAGLSAAMLALIDRIRKDKTFPETVHIVSHAWLRIGPLIDDPAYRPGVWVGWRKPSYYWIGIGSFGTQRRITVTGDKVIPMLKRYLKLLHKIDPEFAPFFSPTESETEDQTAWTSNQLIHKYAALTVNEVLPVLADDVAAQVSEVRQLGDQMRDVLNSLKEMDAAQEALDELLKRAERISNLINAGMERYRVGQIIADAADADTSDGDTEKITARTDPLHPPKSVETPEPLQVVQVNGNGHKG
jgi:hypothetical protein